MNSNFKKLAIAAGVSSALSMMSMPSQAVIQGSAGEALLVPLVVYATQAVSQYEANTIIQVSIPGSIGFDDIPNIFVAPSTTPTNPGETPEAGPTLFPSDAEASTIHWYWFDHRSVHRLDRPLSVTANDIVQINWRESARSSGQVYDGIAGYMVIGTETARRGQAADFNMFGDAWLVFNPNPGNPNIPEVLASIPVLPMSDGEDGTCGSNDRGLSYICSADNVVYSGGIPRDASPLISGMRTNRSDGIPDITVFDVPLFDRTLPSIHVVWLDENLDADGRLAVDVYDSEEVACSATVEIPNELNVLWIPPVDAGGIPDANWPLFFAQHTENLCLPDIGRSANFVSYYLPEYVDTNADAPESAGIAFSLFWNGAFNGVNTWQNFEQTMILGHERGTFRQ